VKLAEANPRRQLPPRGLHIHRHLPCTHILIDDLGHFGLHLQAPLSGIYPSREQKRRADLQAGYKDRRERIEVTRVEIKGKPVRVLLPGDRYPQCRKVALQNDPEGLDEIPEVIGAVDRQVEEVGVELDLADLFPQVGVDGQALKGEGVVVVEVPAVAHLDGAVEVVEVVAREVGRHPQLQQAGAVGRVKAHGHQVGLAEIQGEVKGRDLLVEV